MFQYLYQQGCLPVKEMNWLCDQAVFHKDTNILKYLHEQGCPWDKATKDKFWFTAIEREDIQLVIYLHEQGCRWNEKTCDDAAYYGHLELLQYLRENGCL